MADDKIISLALKIYASVCMVDILISSTGHNIRIRHRTDLLGPSSQAGMGQRRRDRKCKRTTCLLYSIKTPKNPLKEEFNFNCWQKKNKNIYNI